ARVKKEIPSIKSSLSFDSGYYNSISSIDEEEQRYNFDLYLLSRVYGNINNNITARYMQTNRTYVSVVDDEIVKSDYSTASIMEALEFSFTFDARGRMRFLVGAEYINRKYDNETEKGLNPRVDVNMNYRLFQRWTFDASARMTEMYNVVDHSGNANLNFRAGKTTFLMGYQYNNNRVDSVLNTISNERSIFKVQLTREF
ncbi:MAG: hypothetical protein QG617_680, partial [Campylobacterota bacterium]|nr:hypothetical protein [Campylobacterota bacterium]